jgi:hypothetical protein
MKVMQGYRVVAFDADTHNQLFVWLDVLPQDHNGVWLLPSERETIRDGDKKYRVIKVRQNHAERLLEIDVREER